MVVFPPITGNIDISIENTAVVLTAGFSRIGFNFRKFFGTQYQTQNKLYSINWTSDTRVTCVQCIRLYIYVDKI